MSALRRTCYAQRLACARLSYQCSVIELVVNASTARWIPDITIFRENFAAICAAVWALRQIAPRGGRTDFSQKPHATESGETAPAVFGPWGCFCRGPATGTRAVRSCLETPPRRNAPVFAEASGPAGRRAGTLRRAPKSIIVPRASCTKASHLAIYVISDHIAALSAARLYFAPVLRSTTALIAPVHHNQ